MDLPDSGAMNELSILTQINHSCSLPPCAWMDDDLTQCERELARLVPTLARVEELVSQREAGVCIMLSSSLERLERIKQSNNIY